MRALPAEAFVRFKSKDILALDRDASGAVTAKDVTGAPHVSGLDSFGEEVHVAVTGAADNVGRAARMFSFAKRQVKQTHVSLAPPEFVDIPAAILRETGPERALLAADSYAPFLRTTRVPAVLDGLLARPDPKLGVFAGGIAGRTFGVVGEDGSLEQRVGTYDGTKAFLYVLADDPEAKELLRAASDPKYAKIAVRTVTREQLASRDERLAMRFDRPGMFYVNSRCPVLPAYHDDSYVVPGGRFGMELYYHDTRINSVSARSSVAAARESGDAEGAEHALSALRGTANALVNEMLGYGKIMNASMTTSVSRSQAPCLTTVIRETYAAWTETHPEQIEDAKTWLAWAAAAAEKEYRDVWLSPPRFDEKTGLSGYVDETPSQAPEEAEHFYAGMEWSAADLASDAAIREHGHDSMPAAILTEGPDRGKPRMHELLPVCLQSLLYKYERDLAWMARELGNPSSTKEAKAWDAAAEQRAAVMNARMWSEEAGCYRDLVRSTGAQNGAEDLRSLNPLWAGIVDDDPTKAKRMRARARDYLRPGGVATATAKAWGELYKLNPDYVERCQWGHKDIGWPITTYELVEGLKRTDGTELAHEIAYRWCLSVQREMDTHGGLHVHDAGGYTAPVFEKMNVTEGVHDGAAQVGYGNQGGGNEGENGGFRWGLDAYKLLYRALPGALQAALRRGDDPDAVFSTRARLSSAARAP